MLPFCKQECIRCTYFANYNGMRLEILCSGIIWVTGVMHLPSSFLPDPSHTLGLSGGDHPFFLHFSLWVSVATEVVPLGCCFSRPSGVSLFCFLLLLMYDTFASLYTRQMGSLQNWPKTKENWGIICHSIFQKITLKQARSIFHPQYHQRTFGVLSTLSPP